MRWLSFVLVACGSAPPPTAPPLPVVVAKPIPPPAPVTCSDASVVLRGAVEDSRKAGPAKEAAIASACLHDKWSQPILDCIGKIAAGELLAHSIRSTECLALLSPAQRVALDEKLSAWMTVYQDESWVTAEDERIANLPPEIPCRDIIHTSNVLLLAPPIVATGEEREFQGALRRASVLSACEAWPPDARQCSRGGSIESCRSKLDATQAQVLTDKLAAVDVVMGKIAAVKKKPAATYDCKAVVAAHYSDAAWRGKAEPAKDPKATRAELTKQAADRKTMIAESRRLMTDACTKEAWSATLRACLLVENDATCRQSGPGSPANPAPGPLSGIAGVWGFPPLGVTVGFGVPECDAYGTALRALVRCNQAPQTVKDTAMQSHAAIVQMLVRNPSWTTPCKQGADSLLRSVRELGCKP